MGWQDAPIIGQGGNAWEQAPLVEQIQAAPPPQAEQQQQIIPPQQPPAQEAIAGAAPLMGVVEPVLQMGSGLAASAAGGLRGLGTLATGGGMEQAAQNIQETQEKYTYQPQHPTGQAVSNVLAWPVEKAVEGWGMIGEQTGNLLSPNAGAAGKAIGETGVQALAVLGGRPWRLGAKAPKSFERLAGEMTKIAKTHLDKAKAISPAKQGSYKAAEDAYVRAGKAIESIVKRKDEILYTDEVGALGGGKVPKNLTEFSQAIGQIKEVVFNKYDAMRVKAGEKVQVGFDKLFPELEVIIKDEVMTTQFPAVVEFAQTQLEAFKKQGSYTTKAAQDAVAKMNAQLRAFDKRPDAQLTTQMEVQALIRNHIRKGLDEVIESVTGEHYAPLKAEYGALKSIEQAVTQRMLRQNQKAGHSALNFYEVLSAHNLLSGNIVSGGGMAGVSAWRRMMKDPDRQVKQMFKKAEKAYAEMQKLMPEKEMTKIVAEVEQKMLPPGQNQLALPPPAPAPAILQGGPQKAGSAIAMGVGPDFYSPLSPLERMYQIAQSPIGRDLLIERLGREAKHTKLLTELLNIPSQLALPLKRDFVLRGRPGTPADLQTTKARSRYNALSN